MSSASRTRRRPASGRGGRRSAEDARQARAAAQVVVDQGVQAATFSLRRPRSRSPACRRGRTRPPMSKKMSSCVRPGVCEVRARALRPVSALTRLDLPTLERPANAIEALQGRQVVGAARRPHEIRLAGEQLAPALQVAFEIAGHGTRHAAPIGRAAWQVQHLARSTIGKVNAWQVQRLASSPLAKFSRPRLYVFGRSRSKMRRTSP